MCTLLLDMIQYLSRELAPASPPGRPAIHAPRGKYRNCEDMAMNLKEEAKREKKKLSQMSWSDRIWYIWEYYKFHILAVLLIIGLFSTIGTILYRKTFTTRLTFAIVNDHSGGASSTEQLKADLHQALGYGPKDVIEFNEGLYAAFDQNSASQYAYATMMKITALAASGSLDIMIADQSAIDHYAQSDAFLDLRQLLPDDLYKELEENGAIYSAPDESGQTIPLAVSLENTNFEEVTGISMDPPYLGVISGSSHTEDVLRTIRYLFQQ